MSSYNELLISASDAASLASVVADRRHADRREADAADALADVLINARMIAHDRLPGDRVAMNSRVAYREEPSGACRTVVLVHPSAADPSDGRISVLSPVGRALLGRQTGSTTSIGVPGGRALTIHVLEIERACALDLA